MIVIFMSLVTFNKVLILNSILLMFLLIDLITELHASKYLEVIQSLINLVEQILTKNLYLFLVRSIFFNQLSKTSPNFSKFYFKV